MLIRFLKDETGVELAEYAVAAALIATTGSKMQDPQFP
jgi:Flp pilus assembly pilin Flp